MEDNDVFSGLVYSGQVDSVKYDLYVKGSTLPRGSPLLSPYLRLSPYVRLSPASILMHCPESAIETMKPLRLRL